MDQQGELFPKTGHMLGLCVKTGEKTERKASRCLKISILQNCRNTVFVLNTVFAYKFPHVSLHLFPISLVKCKETRSGLRIALYI